jgi:hypothetical protein
MPEAYLHALSLSDVADEDPAVTRDRLKDRFPRGATRRMTQLGLLIGSALEELVPQPDDTVVYASAFAETRALEGYLDSFPSASPTLFQTSIHPSAVQQALIGRQHAVKEFFPLTGRAHLVVHALQTALLAPGISGARVLVCGGEERGTWLLKQAVASERSFAFAFSLSAKPAGALARISLSPEAGAALAKEFLLHDFFTVLKERRNLDLSSPLGLRLALTWL